MLHFIILLQSLSDLQQKKLSSVVLFGSLCKTSQFHIFIVETNSTFENAPSYAKTGTHSIF